jgi:hypothetical protein
MIYLGAGADTMPRNILLVGAMTLAIVLVVKNTRSNRMPDGSPRFDVEAWLAATAEHANAQLPKDLGGGMSLVRVDAEGRTYRYYLAVKGAAHDANTAAWVARLRERVTRKACQARDLKLFWHEGVTVSYRYLDQDGQLVGEIAVEPGQCV